MELIILLFAVTLLHSEGSNAVTPVFVKKGGDVLLEVRNADALKDFYFVEWNFKKTGSLVRFAPGKNPNVFPNYTGRLEFPVKNYSVNLKNLQHTDSGVYTARVARHEGDQTLAEYSVTVQDPVSPVDLTVNSVSRSSDSCNVTVTCRTQDFYINSTFTCDTQTCRQEGGEQSKVTTSGASLQVYLDLNGSVICHNSNQVSQAKDIKMIEKFCLQHDEQPPYSATIPVVVGVVVSVITLPHIAVALFLYYRKRRKDEKESMENTVYGIPQTAFTAPAPDQRPTRDVSELSSTYAMVGPHTGTVGSTETRDKPLPESLYAQVEKPGKPLKK